MGKVKCAVVALVLAGVALAAEPLTNEIIIKMWKSEVPAETIVRTIQAAEGFHFGTLPGDLIELQQAGVPDDVVRALAARINYPGSSWRVVVPVQITPPAAPAAPAAQEKPAKPEEKPAKAPKINASAKPAKAPVPMAVLAGLQPIAPEKPQPRFRRGTVRWVFYTIWKGFERIF